MNIGDAIKAWRIVGGLTLAAASKRIVIPLPTLARVEAGKPIDGKTMWKLMVFLFGQVSA